VRLGWGRGGGRVKLVEGRRESEAGGVGGGRDGAGGGRGGAGGGGLIEIGGGVSCD